jgi:large subunit ribosomal protein L25
VDFVNTARDVKTHAEVPLQITGESRGVREGGVIEHHLWDLRVEALPTDIPSSLEADISHLGIGDHLRVVDVTPPPGVDIVSEPDEIILSVVEPQAARGGAEGEGAEGAGEGEASSEG